MAEVQPSLHIDTDWKKQAQEEKRRLAETAGAAPASPAAGAGASAPPPPPTAARPGAPASAGATAARGRPGAPRELPPPSFGALVQSIVTQILFYLGDLSTRGVEPTVNLDMAKYQIDILGVLEEK